ncbi:MAG: hypothetical protein KDD22_05265, partial [Bdellovibrionales bacterium]|nr:hypothetical protein [Bdellovibrionales bacterium]
SLSAAIDLKASAEVLKAVLASLTAEFKQSIKSSGVTLPETPINIEILLAPYPATPETDLRQFGFRAEMPFAVIKRELNPKDLQDFKVTLQEEIDESDLHADEQLPAYLKIFSTKLTLMRSNPQVETQTLLGLRPVKKSIDVENPQIHLTEINIPDLYRPSLLQRLWSKVSGKVPQTAAVSMLISHIQELNAPLNPNTQISFGGKVLINENIVEKHRIEIPPTSPNRYLCWSAKNLQTVSCKI